MTPSWMVDATALRSTLDDIRRALSVGGTGSATDLAHVLLHDRSALLGTVRAVLDVADASDIRAHRVLSGVVSEYRNPEQVLRLRSLLGALQEAWGQRLRLRLDAEKVSTLRALLAPGVPDFLSVIERTRDENTHSQVVRWLLDPSASPSIAAPALRRLVARLPDARLWLERLDKALGSDLVSVKREFTIGREWGGDEQDRIDLVVSGPGFLLAIENKTHSSEGRSQTWSYWRWLQSISGLRAGLFLTPTGGPAECPHFVPLSYLDLLDCLLEGAAGLAASEERDVLASYARTLANHTMRTELRRLMTDGGPNERPE